MKTLIILIVVGLLFSNLSCTNKDDSSETNGVEIRIKNTSQYDYSNLLVNTSGGFNNYGNISSTQSSDYKAFSFAYNYAFVELDIAGITYTLQPIDYVGETKLSSGKYTYEINANDSGTQYDKLTLTLVKD
jgi:hypothetical protein